MTTELELAFPEVDPGLIPFGSRVLVQIRSARSKSAGGIILTDSDKDTEQSNTQVAKVLSMGAVAFRNRTTLESWPEGDWCKPGQFIRTPKYGGDRWEVTLSDGAKVGLAIFNDLDLIGSVTGDPLKVRAFI